MTLVVVTRYVVPEAEGADFREHAREALDALRRQTGCRRGHVGRSMDEPQRWLLQTEWDTVGAYRRALSSYDVKVRAVPVMYRAIDEPTAYEVLVEGGPDGLSDAVSDRAAGAAESAPRQFGAAPDAR